MMRLINALALWTGVHFVAAQQDCSGYKVSNVQQSDNRLTAALQLAGPACNIYGTDLPNLTLTVEHQSSNVVLNH